MASKKPKLKRSVRVFFYTAILCICFFTVYGTLFVRAYPNTAVTEAQEEPIAMPDDTADTSTDTSDQNTEDASSDDTPEPEYTVYENTGETVATVLLDPGHGGVDGGNVASDGTLEKDLNLTMTLKIKEALNELNPQLNVLLTRDTDDIDWNTTEYEDLAYRTDLQTSLGADYFVSIHANSFTDPDVKGYTFYLKGADSVMTEMSEKINQNLQAIGYSEYFGTVPTEDYPLQVVSSSSIHSMLIELGFMTNESDLNFLTTESWQNKAAKAIAAAISDEIMEQAGAAQSDNQDEVYTETEVESDTDAG